MKPITDFNVKSHDYRTFQSLLGALTNFAQTRLLGIIRNKKRLVEALPWVVRRNGAHLAATPTPTQTTAHQGVAMTIHRTRTKRVPESTAIT